MNFSPRTAAIILHDILAAVFAWLAAYWLRFNLAVPPEFHASALSTRLGAAAAGRVPGARLSRIWAGACPTSHWAVAVGRRYDPGLVLFCSARRCCVRR
jgi:hypothetical protein